jgi:hypothetical protein
VQHLLDIGGEVSVSLTDGEKAALKIQRSRALWKEPKELLLTLATCCLASLTQGKVPPISEEGTRPGTAASARANCGPGWDQVANGNLGKPLQLRLVFFLLLTTVGWPGEFGLKVDINNPSGRDTWIFGAIQAMPWFSAAILGSYLSDPVSEFIGRYACILLCILVHSLRCCLNALASQFLVLLKPAVRHCGHTAYCMSDVVPYSLRRHSGT